MSPKGSLRKLILGAVAIVPALALANAPARAEVLADAILVVENFVFASDATGTPYTLADVQIVSATNFANTGGVGLVSAGGSLTQAASNGILPPGDLDSDVNLTGVSEGASPIADDNYTPLAAPPPVTSHFAYADSDVNGTAIDVGAPTTGATAQTRAASGLTSSDTGDADANTGLNATFNFIAQEDGELWISFDYFVSLMTFVSEDDSILDADALARSSWSINVTDEDTGTVGSFSPSAINQSRSRNEVSDGLTTYTDSGSFTQFLLNLIAGNEYSVTITHQVFIDTSLALQEVAEPTTLLLFGGGLVMLAFAARWKANRSTAAV